MFLVRGAESSLPELERRKEFDIEDLEKTALECSAVPRRIRKGRTKVDRIRMSELDYVISQLMKAVDKEKLAGRCY